MSTTTVVETTHKRALFIMDVALTADEVGSSRRPLPVAEVAGTRYAATLMAAPDSSGDHRQ